MCRIGGQTRSNNYLQASITNTRFYDVDIIPFTTFVIGLAGDNRLYKYDTSTNCDRTTRTGCVCTITDPISTQLLAISVAGDANFFVAAGEGGFLYLFNATTVSVSETFYRYSEDFLSVRVSDSGDYIAAARRDGIIDIYRRNCKGCKTSQYFDGETETCKWCAATLPGCAACTNSTNCIMCFGGYYLDDTTSTCKLCREVLDGCVTCYND